MATLTADSHALEGATRTLALLQAQAESLRAEIAGLRIDLADARSALTREQEMALVEANGKLVVSALEASAAAETASSELEELTRSSQRDPLTGTPNRALMLDRLQSAMSLAQRHGSRAALLFVDLDGFKQINDELGHAIGDEVLVAVAGSLVSILRASDTVSRHGGDEFLILLAEVVHVPDAVRAARKVLAAVADAGSAIASPLRLSASVGIAIYPDDGTESGTLIACADAAMYRAKRTGAGGFAVHGRA